MLKAILSLIISTSMMAENAEYFKEFTDATPVNKNIMTSAFFEISTPPTKIENAEKEPIINAKGSIAIDIKSGKILFNKNDEEKLSIGSITKLMTVIIILEENKLNEEAQISRTATQVSGVKMWLYEGEKISVESLLKGALLPSANDAAYALAEHNSGNVAIFVEKMNKKAQLLGLKNTNFANPMGFDNSKNYSTAKDLAILATYALKKTFIRQTVQKSSDEVYNSSEKIKHKLESTNKLLTDEFAHVKGVKTGNTDQAGLCFLSLADKDNNEVITVILGSPARFTETKILLEWIYKNYTWPKAIF